MTATAERLGISGRIARFFLGSQLTPLIALIAALMGLFAIAVTPREEEPQINVTMANVFIPFVGASVKDVESLVATPAEQVLSQISGIDHLYSVSKPGMAILTVQFKVGEDRTQALVRLYDAIQANRDWVPRELGVGQPIIKPLGIDDVPIVTINLWTADPARGGRELAQVAHAAEIELKRIPGTREVTTTGGAPSVVRVVMDAERMAAYNISANELRNALQRANVAQPSGTLTDNNRDILVETGIFLKNAADVAQLVVGVADGRPVFVSDIATVTDHPDQPKHYVWTGFGAGSPDKARIGQVYPAVTLAISKQPGKNAVDVANAVVARIKSLQGSVIPVGIHASVSRNYGVTANDKAQKLIHKLIFATSAVVLLVLFALGKREALIVGAAVLLTLAATLFASWAIGFTLNRVSLFALIFSIGILVDDAIVVVENIHRRMNLDHDGLAAIIPRAVDEVGGPTILATLTVIAALLPMAFVSGLMGPYMSPIPINASIGMLISLAIAFVVTPWLALHLIKAEIHAAHDTKESATLRFFRRRLTPFLRGADGKRNRNKLWLGIGIAIAASLALPATQLVILKMLPFDNKSEFQIVLDMPTGTALETTAQVLGEMGRAIARVPEVADYQVYAGTAAPINFNGLVRQYYLRSGADLGDIQVNLTDQHVRARKSHEIAVAVLPQIEAIARRYHADVKLVEVPPGPPVMSPIVAEVYGPDYAGQTRVAKLIRGVFEKTPGISAIDDTVEDSAPRWVLHVQQTRAALAGISQQQIVDTLRAGLAGDDVTPIHDSGAKYAIPVRIELDPARASTLANLLKLGVRGADGKLIPLSELVEAVPDTRERAIYHKDLLPVVYVVGDMTGHQDSPLYGLFEMRGQLKDRALAEGGTLREYFTRQPHDPYAAYSYKWDGEWQVTYETFRDMGLAYAFGLLLIYLLVVAQFKSYVTPLVIMAPIPLTIIGVMPGHALLGAQFTATSMIGMIALAGIIVRNSILLVDFIQQQIAAGMDFQQAVIEAGAARAKPIILTGLAAMLGAFFILDDPIFNGLAIALIFGILVSTVLTLVVIPVLYYAANYRAHAAGAASDRT
jgi:multidrug efflux pump subunit AcrB